MAIVDGNRTFALAELETYAKLCASHVAALTDRVNRPVAVFLPKSAETVIADLGVIYSGNAYTNLDTKSPDARVAAVLEKISPEFVITSRDLETRVASLGVSRQVILLIEDLLEPSTPPDVLLLQKRRERVLDTDPLCIISTSGSTGTPKGVALTHRGTIDFMDWVFERFDWTGDIRIGSLSPFHFDIYTLELFLCLAKGATLVIVPEEKATFPATLMDYLQEHAVSFLFWVPTIMVHISNQGLLEGRALPPIRKVFFAGEVLPTRHLNRWRRAFPEALFVNLYGPIEIHVDCTYFIVDRELSDDEPIPIGFPCRNTDVLILNDADEPCSEGEPGELCVRGSSVALGYWNDVEQTARSFTQNPLQKHYPETIYRTGDLVRTNGRGEILFIGRRDFQVKHMGYRIELPDVEHAVLRIDGVANACVLYDQNAKAITLFYEANRADLTPTTIRRQLLLWLPKYMIPTAFRPMAGLPRNANGKIDRNGLSQLLREGPQ